MTSYFDHVSDFNAVLHNNFGNPACVALGRLRFDGLAQIVSFLPNGAIRRMHYTLGAVSAQARLDSEVCMAAIESGVPAYQAQVCDQQLWCCFTSTYRLAKAAQGLSWSVWWADRCGLPLRLEVINTRTDILTQLTRARRERVGALKLWLIACWATKEEIQRGVVDGVDAPLTELSSGTFLSELATFSQLRELSIHAERSFYNPSSLGATVACALRAAKQLRVEKLQLRHCERLDDLTALSTFHHLQHLTVRGCNLQSLDGLETCFALSVLDVSCNENLKSVAAIANLQRLTKLLASSCDLQNVEDLSRCAALSVLDLSHNFRLSSVSELRSLQQLETLLVRCVNLQSVDGLNNCGQLTELDVSSNSSLKSLSGLAGAPQLATVRASYCGLLDVDGLSSCPRLTYLDLDGNNALQSLRGLAGAPELTRLTASHCDLRHLDGLGKCLRLEELNVSHNAALQDLRGLAGALCLQTLVVWCSGLESLDGVGSCPQLCEIDARQNLRLQSVGDALSCCSLRVVDLTGCTLPVADSKTGAVRFVS